MAKITLEKLKQEKLLKLEFEDMLYSDKDFNYNKNEFEEWLIDLVLPLGKTGTKHFLSFFGLGGVLGWHL